MIEIGKNLPSERVLSHVPRLKSWDAGQTPKKRDNVRDKKRDKEQGFSLLALIKARKQAREAGQCAGQDRDKPCPTGGTRDAILSHLEKAEIGNFLDQTQDADKGQESARQEILPLEEIIAAGHDSFPDGAPLLYPTMPDWRKFCELPRRCGGCLSWRHKTGYSWWCGLCTMDGKAAGWKSCCRQTDPQRGVQIDKNRQGVSA